MIPYSLTPKGQNVDEAGAEAKAAMLAYDAGRLFGEHYNEAMVLADLVAERIELAVVQRVPQALLDVIPEGMQHTYPLVSNKRYAALQFAHRGDVLEFRFEVDGQSIASFRFGSKP